MTLYVVTGPPAAGKSTWVRQHAKQGDIVIDYDRLAHALTAEDAPSHNHTRHVKNVAFRARSAAIDEALKYAHDVDVYVIHSLPPGEMSARYTEHGARVITIDPGHDEVMQRIADERPHTARHVAQRWYAAAGSDTQLQHTRSSRDW